MSCQEVSPFCAIAIPRNTALSPYFVSDLAQAESIQAQIQRKSTMKAIVTARQFRSMTGASDLRNETEV